MGQRKVVQKINPPLHTSVQGHLYGFLGRPMTSAWAGCCENLGSGPKSVTD